MFTEKSRQPLVKQTGGSVLHISLAEPVLLQYIPESNDCILEKKYRKKTPYNFYNFQSKLNQNMTLEKNTVIQYYVYKNVNYQQ